MVDFGTDYWHAMDKDKVEKISISPRDMGISNIGDPWAQLQLSLKAGANHVELSFIGRGRGNVSSPISVTPESVSKDKREDIRQMAKLNNVTLSTHASAQAGGFAGLGEGGRFSDQAAESNMQEVRKAMDFAADTAEGGTVVIHTGEFPRSLADIETRKVTKDGKKVEIPRFKAFGKEDKEGVIYLVNTETGKVDQAISKDTILPTTPARDKKTNQYLFNEEGEMQFEEEIKFEDYAKNFKSENGTTAEEQFFIDLQKEELLKNKAELGRLRSNLEMAYKQTERIKKQEKKLREMGGRRADLEATSHLDDAGLMPKTGTAEFDTFQKDPVKFLTNIQTKKVQSEIEYTEQGVEGHSRKIEQLKKEEGKIKTISGYALERSAKNIGRLGRDAYKMEQERNLKNPLIIAAENIGPESYGGHPAELKEIIIQSREQMAKQLVTDKLVKSKKEADKIAAERIKATFDIAHANTWRKYFEGSDKDFDNWLTGETKKLAKEGIIGHVHLADNFGFEDEHLTPGQGNSPIEDFVKGLREEGYTGKFVVEPGGQTEGEGGMYTALTGAWEHLANSPIYRTSGGVAQSWTDVSGGYLGSTNTPRHVSGTYLPSKDWSWYSETPIE